MQRVFWQRLPLPIGFLVKLLGLVAGAAGLDKRDLFAQTSLNSKGHPQRHRAWGPRPAADLK
jgi:hypothetical protein